jgi:hypothetical protein
LLPNFLLIGAAKAGTTSLHFYLDQHPEIFMSSLKEPGFFAFEGTRGHFPTIRDAPFVTDLASYETLFKGAHNTKVIGESSPQYLGLASPNVIRRIKKVLPDVYILAVLRQPVEQAYSHFVMLQRGKRVGSVGFREKFLSDMEKFHELSCDLYNQYVVKSYHDRLRLYVDAFDARKIKIMLYDDLVSDPGVFMAEIYRFLGVDTDFKNDFSVKLNQGGLYSSHLVSSIMNRPNPIRWLARRLVPIRARIAFRLNLFNHLTRPAPKLDPILRAELTALLYDEISDLEHLTGRDLSAWRSAP